MSQNAQNWKKVSYWQGQFLVCKYVFYVHTFQHEKCMGLGREGVKSVCVHRNQVCFNSTGEKHHAVKSKSMVNVYIGIFPWSKIGLVTITVCTYQSTRHNPGKCEWNSKQEKPFKGIYVQC